MLVYYNLIFFKSISFFDNFFNYKILDATDFNFNSILENNKIPLLIGGDHSTVIGSALASQKYHNNIGIIWVDAHGDYNTFETTTSGNIHGLPFAAICSIPAIVFSMISKKHHKSSKILLLINVVMLILEIILLIIMIILI